MDDIGTKNQILKEIHYRRDKQWNIFSWVSSLILAAIGGVVTISSSNYFQLTFWHGLVLSLAILCLGIYSCYWLTQNIDRESEATKIIKDLDHENNLNNLYIDPEDYSIGYANIVGALSFVAIIFFLFSSRLQQKSSVVYNDQRKEITVTLPTKRVTYKKDKLDTAIKQFRDDVSSK